MSQSQRKRCRYCHRWFQPDSRVGDHQKACSKESCRKQRKKQSQKRWVNKNPDYFKGRYENTREWLKKHPGYLKKYRKTHPEYVEKNRNQQRNRRVKRRNPEKKSSVDIQDTMKLQGVVRTEDSFKIPGVDIQDTIGTQLIVPVYVSDNLLGVDIQDDIYRASLSMYTCARVITRTKLKEFIKGVCHGRRGSYRKNDITSARSRKTVFDSNCQGVKY
jgi:hypothetical protein